MNKSPYLNSKEAAEYIRCSEITLRISRCTGILYGKTSPTYRKCGKTIIYEREILNEWLKGFSLISNTSQYNSEAE